MPLEYLSKMWYRSKHQCKGSINICFLYSLDKQGTSSTAAGLHHKRLLNGTTMVLRSNIMTRGLVKCDSHGGDEHVLWNRKLIIQEVCLATSGHKLESWSKLESVTQMDFSCFTTLLFLIFPFFAKIRKFHLMVIMTAQDLFSTSDVMKLLNNANHINIHWWMMIKFTISLIY